MKLSRKTKEQIAKKAAEALIAKKRDAAYETLRKELTLIAERQFANVPIKEMKKYGEYIEFQNNLKCGEGYPTGFIDVERRGRRRYEEFGFVPSDEIPLLKWFPRKAFDYNIQARGEYAADYTKAVRKYMLLYFKTEENYRLILESLHTVSTDKQLADEFPELVIFCTMPEEPHNKQPVPTESISRCKMMLKEARSLFLESLDAAQ
jgi:hypothetical protein